MYKTKFDNTAIAVTILFIVASISLIAYSLKQIELENNLYMLIIAFVVIINLYFLSQVPTEVILNDKSIILKKVIGKTVIVNPKQLYKVSHFPSMTLSSKGAYGYQGGTMDNFRSYVTDKRNIIAVVSNNSKYLFSCNNSERMLNEWSGGHLQ